MILKERGKLKQNVGNFSQLSHGKANMIRFNYFEEAGAFSKDESTGRYKVNFEKLEQAFKHLQKKLKEDYSVNIGILRDESEFITVFTQAARLGDVVSVEVLSRPHDEVDKIIPKQ